jgi:lauroyl/myristoyl acyltransferase
LIASQIKEMESWRRKEKHNVIEWMIKNRREKDLLQRFPPHKGFLLLCTTIKFAKWIHLLIFPIYLIKPPITI